MEVITIETPSLGDRSYVVHDGSVALVIDPQRDIDRVVDVVEKAGVDITHIAETHLHNDYVSGGLTLARITGATYLHAAAESLRFDYEPVGDGDSVRVGDMRVEVRSTPGHTPHHLSYVVSADGCPPAVFSGGSMLYGTVGRTDLIGPEATDELTRAQFRSVHQLADTLPDEAQVYPTHGFGSFCASASSDEESDGTLGTERRVNIALTENDEDAFVGRLLDGLDDYPSYYAQMGPLNTAGGVAIDLSPAAPVDPVELARRIHRGEWVVDLRPRREFAQEHLAGTIGVQLADGFSTYLAWLIPWACHSPCSLTIPTRSPRRNANSSGWVSIDRAAPRQARSPSGLPTPTDAPTKWSSSRISPPTMSMRRFSTFAAAVSSIPATSTAPRTSRCTSCSTASKTFPAARSMCTARAATGPASPHRCSIEPATTSCSSTTASTTPPTLVANFAHRTECPVRIACDMRPPGEDLRHLVGLTVERSGHGVEGRPIHDDAPEQT